MHLARGTFDSVNIRIGNDEMECHTMPGLAVPFLLRHHRLAALGTNGNTALSYRIWTLQIVRRLGSLPRIPIWHRVHRDFIIYASLFRRDFKHPHRTCKLDRIHLGTKKEMKWSAVKFQISTFVMKKPQRANAVSSRNVPILAISYYLFNCSFIEILTQKLTGKTIIIIIVDMARVYVTK